MMQLAKKGYVGPSTGPARNSRQGGLLKRIGSPSARRTTRAAPPTPLGKSLSLDLTGLILKNP